MLIATSRFGDMEVDESRLIRFPRGVLGFPDQQEYALIQTSEKSDFYWLQSVHRPELAFVVCDPRLISPDYRVPIKAEELEELGLESAEGAQVFVIVNRYDESLTANLQGPLVMNVRSCKAMQLVLAEKRWTTRHEIVQLAAQLEAVPA